MKLRLAWTGAVVAAISAAFILSALPVVAAATTPDLTPGPSYTLWAYGVVRTVNFSGSSSAGYDFVGSGVYGYSVILNQTNLTSTNFELSANRTMAADLTVTYCAPNCKSPSVTATVIHDAWESVDAWANFTTAANVSEDGTNVSAIGLLNSHTTVHGALYDYAKGAVRTGFLYTNVSANASVSFATPLGLLPDNLTAPSSWTSSAAFSASGSYVIQYDYYFSGPKATISLGPGTIEDSLEATGNVTVAGSVAVGPGSTVVFGGVPYFNVALTVTGPFVAREGFILVPDPVDLFGTSSSTIWGGNSSGGATVEMTSLYVHTGGSHLGIGGSEWLYSSSAINPAVTALVPASPTDPSLDEIAPSSNSVGETPVQGVPMSVDQAQGVQNCLISGSNCPSSGPSGRPYVPGLFLGIVAVVVVGVVAAVLVAERRRIPPPTYPNALLYPPGAAAPPKPVDPARSGAARPPPAEDDPLSNLW